MRLTKIKLAGFKSFVDPTTVGFPTNLVGVVGPNGCGKSNIIDAVRWVMGEISAKHLRGDSMADVIFNGSGSRKPVGTASVELVFDNSDGKLGGEYSSYAEVSLKRLVARDGSSSYFLNGVRCRRKDITQLFLGTGLGSRSYAIIEQNMISRVIEAKADDMRAFLEEAAGISRYKEKRKESESRIGQTRENLARLGDLRDEVEKQLRHLQRQAATARRYQALKTDERQTYAELLALKLREVETESGARQVIMNERDLALQAAVAEQRSIEAAIERARQEHDAQSAVLSEVQGRYYQVGAEISRTEQAIDHSREIRQRQRQELEQVTQGMQDADLHRVRDRQLATDLDAALAEMGPGLEAARVAEQAAAGDLTAAETAMSGWQEQWEVFNQSLRGASSAAGAERARLEVMDNQLRRLVSQRDRATQEQGTLSAADVATTIAGLDTQETEARGEVETARRSMEELVATLQAERGRERELSEAAQAARRETQDVEGRIVSLEALQRAALGQGQGKVVDWLKSRGLERSARLAAAAVGGQGLGSRRRDRAGRLPGSGLRRFDRRRRRHARQLECRHGHFLCRGRRPGRLGPRGRYAARPRARSGRSRRIVRGHHCDRNAWRGIAPATAIAARPVRHHARWHLDRSGLVARQSRQGRARRRAGARRAPARRAHRAGSAAIAAPRGRGEPRRVAQPRS